MDPQWRGVAWAPTRPPALVKRRFWVIEGVPKDRYYLYGKIELYIDKVTYQGAWNRKFDWKGDLLGIMQAMAWNPITFTRPSGKVDYNQGSNMAFQCVENLKHEPGHGGRHQIGPDRRLLRAGGVRAARLRRECAFPHGEVRRLRRVRSLARIGMIS